MLPYASDPGPGYGSTATDDRRESSGGRRPPDLSRLTGLSQTTRARGSRAGSGKNEVPERVLYIKVADLQAALDAAVREGARVLIPPTRVPGVVFFALFEDPGGNGTGLVQ